MRTYACGGYGRLLVMHLGKGEGVQESILSACREMGVRNAIVTGGIGSLRKVRYHRIASTEDLPENEYLTVEGPIEMCALQGLILDGEPHLHITCCDREHAFGGHLEDGCEVQYLAEISLAELADADLTRRLDGVGVSYIDRR